MLPAASNPPITTVESCPSSSLRRRPSPEVDVAAIGVSEQMRESRRHMGSVRTGLIRGERGGTTLLGCDPSLAREDTDAEED
jgi:hypothetical protein